jgi:hypothetical protein
MKNYFVIFIFLSILSFVNAYSQYVPNGGFENWETRVLYEEPESWNTGNLEAFMFNVATTLKTADSYSGTSALRLETVVTDEDTLFGYAFCNGTITGGEVSDTLHFSGGIPVSGAPDSLFGYFKYNIPANDTAIVLLSFKKGGTIIGQNIFSLYGTQNTYARMGWETGTMTDTPDTAMVAFACSNPDNPVPGGWLQVDSLWFGGISDSIPNNDFEIWEESSYEEPVNWITANLFSHLFGGDTCATPTEDAHSGSYAIRIESVETNMPEESGMTTMVVGFAIPYSTSFNFQESLPVFDVNFHPTALTGFYKFQPLANDTAMIYISLTDEEENTYQMGTYLFPAAEYTPFEIPLEYPEGVIITEASMVASTTIYFMQGDGQSGEIGSVLYLDDLDLTNPCDAYPPYEIASVTTPTCEDNTATIDAGAGWDEYLWSTEETTQSITVTVTETATYSVTVTDTNNVCQFSDEVEIAAPTGCEETIEIATNRLSGIQLYPNPTSGIFTIEFQNMKAGLYIIEVLDITGKKIISESLNTYQSRKKVSLDLTKYSEGLYLVKVSGEKFNYCERLTVN